MSIHSSLRGVDTLIGERSVYTRIERLQVLMKEGRFDAAVGSVHGLPKVRTRFKSAAKKKAAPKAEAAAETAPVEAPPPEEPKGKEAKGKESRGKESKGKKK